MLHTLECDSEHQRLFRKCTASPVSGEMGEASPELIRYFTDIISSSGDESLISAVLTARYVFSLRSRSWEHEKEVQTLCTLIKAFPGSINHVFSDSWTMSIAACERGCWELWCESLELNGKKIEDVVASEGRAWLLGDDWRQAWKERGLELLVSESDCSETDDAKENEDEEESGDEDGDEDDDEE